MTITPFSQDGLNRWQEELTNIMEQDYESSSDDELGEDTMQIDSPNTDARSRFDHLKFDQQKMRNECLQQKFRCLLEQQIDDRICIAPQEHAWRLFLTTNEKKQAETLKVLAEREVQGNTFFAIGGFCGLNAAAHCGTKSQSDKRINYIVFCDINLRMKKLFEELSLIMKSTKTKNEVLRKVIENIMANQSFYFPKDSQMNALQQVTALINEVSEGVSWLSNDEYFSTIQNIFNKERFVFIPADISDSEKIASITNATNEAGLLLDGAYFTNAREYLKVWGMLKGFRKTITVVHESMHEKGCFIETIPRQGGLQEKYPLEQRIIESIIVAESNLTELFPTTVIVSKNDH